jgi:hypothetical protein
MVNHDRILPHPPVLQLVRCWIRRVSDGKEEQQ